MRIDKAKLLNLKIGAIAAAEESGKIWVLEEDTEGYQIYGNIENPLLFDISRKYSKQPEYVSKDICGGKNIESDNIGYEIPAATANHIKNFDPETALALVRQLQIAEDKLERIERAAAKARKNIDTLPYSEKHSRLLKATEKILALVKPLKYVSHDIEKQ